MSKSDMLDKRWCDIYDNCTSTQTVREWIHNSYDWLHDCDISDERLDNMSDYEIEELVDDIDYLLGK